MSGLSVILMDLYLCIAGNIPNKFADDPLHPLAGEGHCKESRGKTRSKPEQLQGFLMKALVFPNEL